jgi:hypothetical protein
MCDKEGQFLFQGVEGSGQLPADRRGGGQCPTPPRLDLLPVQAGGQEGQWQESLAQEDEGSQ